MEAEQQGPDEGPVLLVVMPPPGVGEDRAHRVTCGPSGVYVAKQLAGLWNGPIVFANSLRCAPGSRKVKPKSFTECRGYLASVIDECNPARIIALGAEACKVVLGQALPTQTLPRIYAYTSTGVPVFVLAHPIACLRNQFIRAGFERNLEWALKADPVRPPTDAVCRLVDSEDDANEACDEIEFAGGVTFDVETCGLPFNAGHTILSLSCTPYDQDTAYIWEREQLADPQLNARILSLLKREDIQKTATNGKFDAVHLAAAFGAMPKNMDHDAFLFRKLTYAGDVADLETLQSTVGMFGGKEEPEAWIKEGCVELKKRASGKWVDTTPTLFADIPKDTLTRAVAGVKSGDNPKTYAYAAIPAPVMSPYNGRDTISTDRLRQDQLRHAEPHAEKVWKKVQKSFAYAMTCMEYNGILADRGRIDELRDEMDVIITRASAEFKSQYGDVNVNSPDQIGELLFKKLKLRGTRKTAKGKLSVTAEVLKNLNHPAANLILELRQSMKFKTQYAEGMAAFIRDDGRIHPHFNISGTETGRPSCQEPNLLNIPSKDSPLGGKCRSIFVAKPGYVFVEGDYNQLELRVAAMLSEDPLMLDIFARGVDYHLETAKAIAPIFGIDPETVDASHPLRRQAKVVNFAFLYGDTPAGIAAKLGIAVRLAEQLLAAILGKLSKLHAWSRGCLANGRRYGYTSTWWDGEEFRRRYLPEIAGHDDAAKATAERSTWNTKVQGTGAEFMNATVGRMQEIIEADRLPANTVLTVYDSLLSEVAESFADEYIEIQREVAEGWASKGVHMKMDFKKGPSWGELRNVA